MKTEKPYLITSALPYANGPLHIGHMVEFVQTDIYSRLLKLTGKKAIYCCADDTHGTPIEVNAAKQGKTPEEFVKEWYNKHTNDLKKYEIFQDSFYTTNSKENKHFTELIFNRLQEKGLIYTKEIELTYCEHDKRFLPDRFVKGKCPKCGAADQYGDVCEKCNSTYNPTDLIEAYCVLCRNTPTRKKSKHYFFRLSDFADKLDKWLTGNKNLQPEVTNQVLGWVRGGLQDWNISRDGPYFGFKIPEEENKYFYVWLDAPVGYIASLANYLGSEKKAEDYWNDSKVVHFIGKDIIYFHLLFWPAVLMGAGLTIPDNIVVHGFLNVNHEKMSKSRGTFLTAQEFAESVDPLFLRYYFASNLTHTMTDIDLDIENFKAKCNNELVSNIANFIYRTLSFIEKNYDSKLSTVRDTRLLEEAVKKAREIKEYYEKLDYREAVRVTMEIGTLGNKYFQDNKPWELIKVNMDETQEVLTDCANLARILAIVIKPIVPSFAENVEKQLGIKEQEWDDIEKHIEKKKIGKAEIVLKKIEEIKLKMPEKKEEKIVEPFSKLDLKVGKIISVSNHYKADKLLLINVDLGKEKRQLVAGLRPYYPDTNVLLGKHIIVVSNLEHANLRGEMSQGMLLAAETEDGKTVEALEAPNTHPGEQVFIDGITPGKETIKYDDFAKCNIYIQNHKVCYSGKQLQTEKEKIITKNVGNGKVR